MATRTMLALGLVSAVALTLSGSAHAALIAYEGFEGYTAGAELASSAGGTGWTGAWAVAGGRSSEVTVAGSGLGYAGGAISVAGGSRAMRYLATDDPIIQLASRQLPSQPGTVYMSFLYSNAGDDESDGDDFIQMGFDESTLPNPQMSAMDRNGEIQVRSSTSTPTSVGTGITATTGETFFLVLKSEKTGASSTYNRVSLFVNPTTATEPATADAVSTTNSGLDLSGSAHLGIRTAFNEFGDSYVFDEIRIGEAYADVIQLGGGPPPAPRETLFEDNFDLDPAAAGATGRTGSTVPWTEEVFDESTGNPETNDVVASGAGEAILLSDGLNAGDYDVRRITRTVDAIGFSDLVFDFAAADDPDNSLENEDLLAVLIAPEGSNSFTTVFSQNGDFGGGKASIVLSQFPLPGSVDDSVFQLRIQGRSNVEDYFIDRIAILGRPDDVIPEPATLALLSAGLVALTSRRRKR
ncbi:PEP-CTERM sorting domain-containing protein [Planctomycetota bacterium]